MKSQPEFKLQKSICHYLDIQYPKTLYLSDTIASVKLTIPQQVRNKSIQKAGFKCPDLLILEPRKGYAGLLIELKTKSPYKKNGELLKNDHVEQQAKTLKELEVKGYKTCFCWSFEMTKKVIDLYLV
ncbi:hypothetical protein SAMN06296241_1378 [Salinimicrobium sediminis]|uniref:VRR-NUC domain-containing protein n=1 Tax=Salinimicrobium sediminis TaxID=1343891 RepID=A0A285X397_9FLAO|nr:hypothetical protein [Salinimicrobium sediminis]SOC79840.1 hypothetical protein SAMN06296241_1378 [Salinimicrobium sediminis]